MHEWTRQQPHLAGVVTTGRGEAWTTPSGPVQAVSEPRKCTRFECPWEIWPHVSP